VFLVFDGDAAGQKASERSLDLLVSEDLDVRVYTVTEGKDPCDAILALGGERFRRSLEAECLDLFEFKWRATVGAEEAQGSAQARAHAVEAFLRLLARVRNPVTRRLILREYTERLGLRDEDVEAMVEKAVDEVARAGRQRLGPSTAPRAQRTAAAPAGAAGAREAVSRSPGAFEPLAEVVLECLLALPREAREIWARVPRGLFRGATGEALWRGVEEELRREVFSGVELARSLSDREAHRLVVRILSRLEPENEEGDMAADYRSIWASCQRDLRRWEIRSRVSELESALSKLAMQDAAGAASSARSGERSAQRETLLRELTSLRKELKKKWTTSSSS
jgi:DNA primase